MIDFVIRDCGYGEFLPLIVDQNGTELYRGDRKRTPELALAKAKEVWEESQTGNIVDFKQANGL